MKHLSIRFRITFWFTAALIVVVLFTYFVVFSVSNQIIQKTLFLVVSLLGRLYCSAPPILLRPWRRKMQVKLCAVFLRCCHPLVKPVWKTGHLILHFRSNYQKSALSFVHPAR